MKITVYIDNLKSDNASGRRAGWKAYDEVTKVHGSKAAYIHGVSKGYSDHKKYAKTEDRYMHGSSSTAKKSAAAEKSKG